MKNITIIFLLLTITFPSDLFSQKMRQGKIFIGTNSLNFISKLNNDVNSNIVTTINNQSSTTSINYIINSDDEFNLNLNLMGGYFIMDNLLFGINTDINTQDVLIRYDLVNTSISDTAQYVLDMDATMMMFGGFLRYYFSLGDGFLFASSGFDYGIGNVNENELINGLGFNETSSATQSNINFGLGYSLKIGDKFSLEPEIVYYMQDKITTSDIINDSNLPIEEEITVEESTQGIKFKLGISFYL